MTLAQLHDELKQVAPQGMALAIDIVFWKKLIEQEAKRSIQTRSLSDLPTPLANVLADVDIDASNLAVQLLSSDKISIRGIEVQFRLRVAGVADGHLSEHEIIYKSVGGNVIVEDGEIKLTPAGIDYVTYPPDVTNNFRQDHLTALQSKWGWSQQQVDYFVQVQEPAAALLVANSLLGGVLGTTSIFPLQALVPSIAMKGHFEITKVVASRIEAIAFVPSHFELVELDECEREKIIKDIEIGISDVNGRKTLEIAKRNTIPQDYYIDNPVGENEGDVYVFVSEAASEKLFNSIEIIENNRDKLASSGDSWEIPPFLISHYYELVLARMLSFEWSPDGPVVNMALSVEQRFHVDVDLKVFKLRADLFDTTIDFKYEFRYSGVLLNDDVKLGFIGELYDPTNIDIHVDVNIAGIGGEVERAIEWLLNKIAVPIIRLYIVFLLISVSWTFVAPIVLTYFQAALVARLVGYVRPSPKEATMAVKLVSANPR